MGKENINVAANFSNKGLEYFNLSDYKNAAAEFEKALEYNYLDYAYYENAATSNYMVGNFDKALKQIDKVINELNPNNGKCEYIKALIFIRLGDQIGACPLLEKSVKLGFLRQINYSPNIANSLTESCSTLLKKINQCLMIIFLANKLSII